MSIPEYTGRRPSGGEEEVEQPTLRRAAGILALVSGILLFIGFLSSSILVMVASIPVFGAAVERSALLAVSGIAFIVNGLMVLVIAVYALIAGISARKRNPAIHARSGGMLWSLLLVILSILYLSLLLATGSKTGYLPAVLVLVAAILLVVGPILVRPGASFASWMAGSILVLVGLLMLLGAVFTTRIGFLEAMPGGREAPGYAAIAELVLDPVTLIGLVVAVSSLVVAPFLGRRRLWVAEIIAIVGVLIVLGNLAFWTGLAMLAIPLALATLSLIPIASVEGVALLLAVLATLFIAIGSSLGLIAGILGAIHLAIEKPGAGEEHREQGEEPGEGEAQS